MSSQGAKTRLKDLLDRRYKIQIDGREHSGLDDQNIMEDYVNGGALLVLDGFSVLGDEFNNALPTRNVIGKDNIRNLFRKIADQQFDASDPTNGAHSLYQLIIYLHDTASGLQDKRMKGGRYMDETLLLAYDTNCDIAKQIRDGLLEVSRELGLASTMEEVNTALARATDGGEPSPTVTGSTSRQPERKRGGIGED